MNLGSLCAPSFEEHQRLRARLDEAEELLRAIREGEVDALLIAGAEGSKVYTVNSADEPYRILVEQMQEGAVTLSADGAVLYCNPRFAGMVRTPATRIIGKDMLPFIASSNRLAFAALLRDSAAGLGRLELSLQAGDGTLVPVYISGNAITLAAEQTLCLLITDLSEQRKLADVLRQSQKLEAMGQLVGGVAHDFNNLLMVISGGLDMLDRKADPARRQRLMDGMRHAAQRGAGLTRQLVTFARHEALQSESVDLAHQIGRMRELLDRSLRGDVNVLLEFADDLFPIEVNSAELELAVLNLAVNARDAMPDGGTIVIRAENAPAVPQSDLDGDFVLLSVIDPGMGIPPEIRDRVFEPFFTTKELGKGSGLGLAQVYGFAKQSGGTVRIESEAGRGTTVVLTLPRSGGAPAAGKRHPLGEVPANAAPAASAGTVLLVEDDDAVAALVAEMMDELDYEVVRVATAAAALGKLASGRTIDIVFSDIMMPGGMNGVDLARELRRRNPGLPVLLTSGYAQAAQRDADREGVCILPKPYLLDELATALQATRDQSPRAIEAV
jgi:signal transduction histidine kinase/ActR/RegA family two-component response regulator